MNKRPATKPNTRKQQLQTLLAQFDELTKELDRHYLIHDSLSRTISRKQSQLDAVVMQIQELTNYRYFS